MSSVKRTLSVVTIGLFSGWVSPSILKLLNGEANVQMNNEEITWLVSILYLANMASPFPIGWLMDKIGRKSTLLWMNWFAVASWLILLFGTQPYHLWIGRFLAGIMYGAVYTVVPMYLAEIAEPKIRGSLGNLMWVMIHIGALIEYTIGPYVKYDTLVIISLSVPLLFAVTFYFIPESPYYLIMKGQTQSAERSLKWLRYDKTKDEISNELVSIRLLTEREMKEGGSFKDLINTKRNRKVLMIAETLAVGQRLSGIVPLIAYSSVTFPKNAIPGLTKKELTIFLGFVWLGAAIISMLLIEKLTRKVLLCISSMGCGISCLIVSAWFYLQQKTDVDVSKLEWIPYVALISQVVFYSLGLGPIAVNIKGELFPANIKGKASAITTMNLALVAFILNKLYLFFADTYGMFLNFLIFGTSCIFLTPFVIFYVIETKGKTFHEIQEELHGNVKSKSQLTETDGSVNRSYKVFD